MTTLYAWFFEGKTYLVSQGIIRRFDGVLEAKAFIDRTHTLQIPVYNYQAVDLRGNVVCLTNDWNTLKWAKRRGYKIARQRTQCAKAN